MTITMMMIQADGNQLNQTISNWQLTDEFLIVYTTANGIEYYPKGSVASAKVDKYDTFPTDPIPVSNDLRKTQIEIELMTGVKYNADGLCIHSWWTLGAWVGIEVLTLAADGVCRFALIPLAAIRSIKTFQVE